MMNSALGYVPNPDYSQENWDEVSDTPELTDAEIAELWPTSEALPVALVDALRHTSVGRTKFEGKAVPESPRAPPSVLAAYKTHGLGWQTRRNEELAAGL